MRGAVLRAIAHGAMGVVSLLVVAWIGRLLGASEVLAVGLGMVVALAPGAYDYLGRDLLGRRIDAADPAEEPPYLWIGKRRLTREADAPLNASDFMYLADQLAADWAYLKPMVEGMTLGAWRQLDPESDIAEAVLASIEDQIDAIPDWAQGNALPMIGLFHADLHALLLAELARDFEKTPVKSPAPMQ